VSALQVARAYLERGWQPIPVPRAKKAPCLKGWQEIRTHREDELDAYFAGETNVTFPRRSGHLEGADCARMSAMPNRKRRSYTPQQKADAVELARKVGSVLKVARDLDLTPSALANWVKRAKLAERGPDVPLTGDVHQELRRLQREVATLRQERDFLKKAAAFFAKEDDRPSS
jgi:transposase